MKAEISAGGQIELKPQFEWEVESVTKLVKKLREEGLSYSHFIYYHLPNDKFPRLLLDFNKPGASEMAEEEYFLDHLPDLAKEFLEHQNLEIFIYDVKELLKEVNEEGK